MKIHPDVLAAHAQFGGDLESMQRLYDSYDHAAEITTLRKELAEARAALEPFARCVKRDNPTCGDEEHFRHMFTYGDLRRAANVLRPPSKAKGEKK